MAKGGHLKSALQSQQLRLKAKQKAAQSAQILQQKAKKTQRVQEHQLSSGSGGSGSILPATAKGKRKEKAPSIPSTAKPIIPFKPTDRILLVGEGNFSFARSLVVDPPVELVHLPPGNITATAYDTEEECYSKYTDAKDIVGVLREKGVKVLFGVDATQLGKVAGVKGQRWDKVMFNFPHAGKGIADKDRNILSNQLLLLGFLSSAAKILTPGPIPVAFKTRKRKKMEDDDSDDEEVDEEEDAMDVSETPTRGTVLVTLRNVVPYTLWHVAPCI